MRHHYSTLVSCLSLLACANTEPAADTNVTEQALVAATTFTPVGIPGLSADFAVSKIAPHTFVMHAYANAVIYDTGEGLLLVDTMRPAFLGGNDLADMKLTLQTLRDRGELSSTDVKTIAYTHWHPDHVGNTDAFRSADTRVVSARGGELRLATPQVIKFFGAFVPPWAEAIWPNHEVSGVEGLGTKVVYAYAPYSHTTTDLIVTLPKERVVIVGDLIVEGLLAFTDVDNGGTMRGLLASLDSTLFVIPNDYAVVPGHFKVMTKSEAKAWAKAIRAGVAYVSARVAQGKTLAEIQASAVLPPEQGGAPAEVQALSGPLLPLVAFVEFAYRDATEIDPSALFAARFIASQERVSKDAMISAIAVAVGGPENAAGTEYDTFAFQVNELKAIDARREDKILSEGAIAAFAIYARYVEEARAAGSRDLTRAAYSAMFAELSAL